MDAIENESLLLYDICCSIGISRSQWKRNIQVADCLTTMVNIPLTKDYCETVIMCGSQAEGLRLFPVISSCLGLSSDFDFICSFHGINVQEHVDTTHTNDAEVFQLLHTDSPEHVLLEVKSYERAYTTFNNTSLSWILEVIKRKHNKYLVSSSIIKDYIQKQFAKKASFSPSIPVCSFKNLRHVAFQVNLGLKNTTIHGPAIMSEQCQFLCSGDYVHSIRCYEWPTAAHEWIDRARPHGWPSQELIAQIMYDGCELVPVGRKDHPDVDEEWKLSFSRAETRLIRNFNIYQAQCYQLLKIVKHHFISSVVADSLSSYHIKTVMFHTVEKTDPKVWRKDNLAHCFMMCLSNLKRYLEDKFLSQYFIVRQNLLEPKVKGDVHQKVLEIVTDLDKRGWVCILQHPLLQTLCQSIQERVGGISNTVSTDADVFALELNQDSLFHLCSTLLLNLLTQVDPVSYHDELIQSVCLCKTTFLTPTTIHPSVETARVLQLLRKSELGILLTVIRTMAHPDIRPGIESMMNFARQCLEESCHADVSSCRLKFATFFFHLGEYGRCIETVQDVLERFEDVWLVVGGLYKAQLENIDTSKLKVKLNRVLQLSDNGFPFISNHLSFPVFFTIWEIAVAPKGVHFLHKTMPRGNVLISDACCIDSIVYAYYLLLESYLKIGEYDLAEHALINMKESIRNVKDMFDRNCLCFSEEDNVLLKYSDRLMTVAISVKDK